MSETDTYSCLLCGTTTALPHACPVFAMPTNDTPAPREPRLCTCGHSEGAHRGGCYLCRQAGERCRVFAPAPRVVGGEPPYTTDASDAELDAVRNEIRGLQEASAASFFAFEDSLPAVPALPEGQEAPREDEGEYDEGCRACGAVKGCYCGTPRASPEGRDTGGGMTESSALMRIYRRVVDAYPEFAVLSTAETVVNALLRKLASLPAGGAEPDDETLNQWERDALSVSSTPPAYEAELRVLRLVRALRAARLTRSPRPDRKDANGR